MQALRKAVRGRWSVFVAFVALVLVVPGVQAQGTAVVRGRVVDAASGVGLPAAVVHVVELHREDRTHEDGEFSLGALPWGTYSLTVQRIGYLAVSRTIEVRDSMPPLDIPMQASPLQLSTTVITGQLSARSAADALSATTALSDAALDRKIGATLGATVAGAPGVSMVSMGPATAKPVVRGLSGDRVLILEDGMRPGDLSNSGADHAVSVDPLTASSVEIVRGPMSLMYGSSALGGVVNVIRQEVPNSLSDRVHGAVSAQVSSVNSGLTLGGYAERALLGVAVRAEATVRTAGDLQTPVGAMHNTGVTMFGGAVGASKVADWGYSGLSYRYYDNAYGLPGGFVGAHPNGVDIAMRRHTVRSETDWHPATGYFESVKANLSFSDYLHEELTGSGSVATRFQQLMTVGEVVARQMHTGALSGGAIGVRAQYRDITTAGALKTPSTADWSASVFVVEEIGAGRLRGQVGLRYDVARFIPLEDAEVVVQGDSIPSDPRTFGALSGSLGGLYRFDNGVRIGASVSRAYRTPDFNELYSDGPHLAAYSYDVGNPRIGQETGLGVDAFVRLERARVRGEIAVFGNQMDGYIFPRNTGELGSQGAKWKFQYSNEDATLLGAEGELAITVREHVVLEATASYVQGTIGGARDTIPALGGDTARLESKYLPLMPPLNGRIGVRYETQTWSYGAGLRLAAAQTRLGDFETETAGYATADVNVGYRLLLGSRMHAFTLRIENLFNAEVREHLSRTKGILPEAGRNISLLYRLQF